MARDIFRSRWVPRQKTRSFAFQGLLSPNINLVGVAATTAVGTPSVLAGIPVDLVGVSGTSHAGSFAVHASSVFDLTGVAATSAVGTVEARVTTAILSGVQGVSAVGVLSGIHLSQNLHLTGLAADTGFQGFTRSQPLHGVSAFTDFGAFATAAGVPGDRTFFIASTTQLIVAGGVSMFPTSDTIDLGSDAYIIGSSQFYTVGQVSWDSQVKTEGVDWELVDPFTHIVQIINLPPNGTPITLTYVEWNIQATQGFEVTVYPVSFSFKETTIIAENIPPIGEYFTVSFTANRFFNNPQSLFTIYPLMVDDMLIDHTSYDEPNGFQSYRPNCYQVLDTTSMQIFEWDGSVWNIINNVANGTQFYVKSLRSIYQNQGGNAVLQYTAGDGTNDAFPQVLTYPLFGEGVGMNLLSDGFSVSAPTNYPAAYAICQTPGVYDSVCQDEDDGGFDEDFDEDFDGG